MSRKFKTSKKNRTNYIYYPEKGAKVIVTPEEVGETFIEILHSLDDLAYNEQCRNDYRVVVHLDAYYDGEGYESNDRNKYLEDDCYNPELIMLEEEEKCEHMEMLDKLAEAKKNLLPQQQDLIRRVYDEKQSITDIAREEGVTEAAIRNRLKKIYKKLRKKLS